MENEPFEDVFPIKHRDMIPLLVVFQCYKKNWGGNNKKHLASFWMTLLNGPGISKHMEGLLEMNDILYLRYLLRYWYIYIIIYIYIFVYIYIYIYYTCCSILFLTGDFFLKIPAIFFSIFCCPWQLRQIREALTAAMQLSGATKVHIGLRRDAQDGQARPVVPVGSAVGWNVGGGVLAPLKWRNGSFGIGEASPEFPIQRGWFFVLLFFQPRKKDHYCSNDSVGPKEFFLLPDEIHLYTTFVFFVIFCLFRTGNLTPHLRQPGDDLVKSKVSATVITIVEYLQISGSPKAFFEFWSSNFQDAPKNCRNLVFQISTEE